MIIFKQGKTNWKYILIVVILAVIVGGGTLGYQWWIAEKEVVLSELPEIKQPEKIIEEYVPLCGNAFCEVDENCKLCPRDCGDCPGERPITLPPSPFLKDASLFKTSNGKCIGKVRLTFLNLNYPSLVLIDELPEGSVLTKYPGKPERINSKLKWVLGDLDIGSFKTIEYTITLSEALGEFMGIEFLPATLTLGGEEISSIERIIGAQCFGPELRIIKIDYPEKIEKNKEFTLTIYIKNIGVEEAVDTWAALIYQPNLPIIKAEQKEFIEVLKEDRVEFLEDALGVMNKVKELGEIKPGEIKTIRWEIVLKHQACYTLPIEISAYNYYAGNFHILRFCSN